MTFLRESAIEKVRLGISTLKEINKVTFIEGNYGEALLTIAFRIRRPTTSLSCRKAASRTCVRARRSLAFEPFEPGVLVSVANRRQCAAGGCFRGQGPIARPRW